MSLDGAPPANFDAERCVLASLILQAPRYEAALNLPPDDFLSAQNKKIFTAIRRLAAAGKPADLVLILEELGHDLEAAGGPAYLGSLVDGVPRVLHVEHYVGIVREKARLRSVAKAGQRIAELAWNANGNAAGVLEQVRILSASIGREVLAERKKLPFRSAAEPTPEAGETVAWLVKGFLAAGALTALTAKVKTGKTTFVTHLVRAILEDRTFLGAATQRTQVIYLTEQPPVSFRVALERAGLLGREDLRLLHFQNTIGTPWPVVAAEVMAECERLGAKLLVVDTMAQFAGLAGDSENDSGAVLEAVRPLQEAAGKGIAVLMVHHDRKSGGEVGDACRGSTALPGVVDIVLSLRRPDGNGRKSLRVLQSLSRFSETPEELVLDLTAGGYIPLGSRAALALEEAREALLSNAPFSEADAVSLQDLCSAGKVKRATAQVVLTELLSAGTVQRVGEGKRGDPFRYFRAENPAEKVSAKTSPV